MSIASSSKEFYRGSSSVAVNVSKAIDVAATRAVVVVVLVVADAASDIKGTNLPAIDIKDKAASDIEDSCDRHQGQSCERHRGQSCERGHYRGRGCEQDR